MIDWKIAASLFAEAEQQPKPDSLPWWLPFVGIAIMFYFMMIRPQKREKQARQKMLDTLKKNDRVATVGGIIGTISNVVSGSDEVMLKVDDNTKIRILRSSIQRVIVPESESDKSSNA